MTNLSSKKDLTWKLQEDLYDQQLAVGARPSAKKCSYTFKILSFAVKHSLVKAKHYI